MKIPRDEAVTRTPTTTELLARVLSDPRYLGNLDWGAPRSGHPEGTIRAHIRDLEGRLPRIGDRLTPEETARIRVLIHTHDTFKPQAHPGAAISSPDSHASLARAFLTDLGADGSLLNMVQMHDEALAIRRLLLQSHESGPTRWSALLATIIEWDVFTAFCLLDGTSAGKDDTALRWFLPAIQAHVRIRFTESDIAVLRG